MEKRITIIGCGPGSSEFLTSAAKQAAARAEVLVGAPRLLGLFSDSPALRAEVGADIDAVLETIATYCREKQVGVLVSGDPGCFSLAKRVTARFGMEACHVIPGISAVQVACARLGLAWAGARIISMHGRESSRTPQDFAGEECVVVLGGGKASAPWIAGLAGALGSTHRVWVCRDLTLETEQVQEVNVPYSMEMFTYARIIVVLVQRKGNA